jgi:NodT family efflux transporter outer membrane factor (OMF) lipoprotein
VTSAVRSHARVALALCLVLLPGCAVGPNFTRPAAPSVRGYIATPPTATATATATAAASVAEAQHFVDGQNIPAEWWALFGSQPLNDLIERALKNNPDIKSAQAAMRVARENVLAQRGALYPALSASFAATRAKTSADVSPTPNSGDLYYSLYTPQVSVSYVPDVFRLNRRVLESRQAQAEQQRFAAAATYITLSTNIVAAAVAEASLRAQIAATQQLIDINTRVLAVLRKQLDRGYVGRLEVAAQESQLAQVSATLPPLLKQLAQQRDLLAVLAGAYPANGLPEQFELSLLQLPQQLPLSLPSQLVRQRPDVLQAEENLHAASAQIGVSVANRLPAFNLTADVGSMAVEFSHLFADGTAFWGLGAGVTQPLFQGGTLLHQQRAAEAAYLQAQEQYRSVVLSAFRDVADTLNALAQDASAVQATASAQQAAATTLQLAEKQWQAGFSNYLALLSAEQASQQAELALIQARAARYTDTAALFQALGGGWWNRGDLEP